MLDSISDYDDPFPRLCASRIRHEVIQTRNPIVIRVVPGTTVGIFLLLVTTALVCATLYHKYRRKTKKESDTAVVVNLNDDSRVTLQLNTCYSPSNRVIEWHTTEEQRSSSLLESTHSYVINSLGLSPSESDQEHYWQPASKEEDLKRQLKTAKVEEVLKDNIK